MSLKKFEKNVQSQFGEDGVIEEIFQRIGCKNKICVEFGAWDGIHLSNAWNLWKNNGWQALLIEGDKKKYDELVNYTRSYDNVQAHHAYVTDQGQNSLDLILEQFKYERDIDFLSIDIDGDDYYILKSLNIYKPRVIIIEYNPTIPPQMDVIQSKGEYLGSSALSILRLAHQKGYKVCHMTETNMFLVDDKEYAKLEMQEPELEELFVTKHLSYIFSSYDGKNFLAGNATYSNFDTIESKVKFPKFISKDLSIKKVIIQNT